MSYYLSPPPFIPEAKIHSDGTVTAIEVIKREGHRAYPQ
jgi:hypothetical protein